MSINTITETFNNHTPTGAVDAAKKASDARDESTDELTRSGVSVINSSHGRCARLVRDRKDNQDIARLISQTDESYFYSLLEDSF